MVVDPEPARRVVEALASSIGDREEEEEGRGAEGEGGSEGGEEEKEKKKTRRRSRRPVIAAWMPAGAGCPLLAGAPFAAEASRPGGMLPWLGCAPYLLPAGGGGAGEGDKNKNKSKKKQTTSSVGRPALAAAWPSMARTALGPGAAGWLADSVFCGPEGEFSPPAALFEAAVVGEGEGEGTEWYWAEAAP